MNKVVLLALTGALALTTQSCSYISDFTEARKEIEKEGKLSQPISEKVETVVQTEPQETEEEIFADLEEAQPTQRISGLIPATNPDVRVRSVVRGRNDPFSIVTLNPRIEIEQDEEASKQSSNVQSNRSSGVQNQSNGQVNNNNNSSNLPPVAARVDPTLAKGVVISGLYEANGRTKLIVQAPDESSSRYVEVGQYLSNGQVLVKSIDKNHFPSPLIILEQGGIEVAKTIGGSAEEEQISFTPTQQINPSALISSTSNF